MSTVTLRWKGRATRTYYGLVTVYPGKTEVAEERWTAALGVDRKRKAAGTRGIIELDVGSGLLIAPAQKQTKDDTDIALMLPAEAKDFVAMTDDAQALSLALSQEKNRPRPRTTVMSAIERKLCMTKSDEEDALDVSEA